MYKQTASHRYEPTYGFSIYSAYHMCSCIGCNCKTSFLHSETSSWDLLHNCLFAFPCIFDQPSGTLQGRRVTDNKIKKANKEILMKVKVSGVRNC